VVGHSSEPPSRFNVCLGSTAELEHIEVTIGGALWMATWVRRYTLGVQIERVSPPSTRMF